MTGYVHPDKILKNVGAVPGDLLVLTKPIGTGVLTTAAKADMVEADDYEAMVQCMATLNAKAAAIVNQFDSVHACTDITGFGLLGHAFEMAEGSDASLKLFSTKIPKFLKIISWCFCSIPHIPPPVLHLTHLCTSD